MSEGKRILCVGLCVLDFVHVCNEFPTEDSDKKSIRGHWQRGGNASNNCTVLHHLGAECEFLGVLSDSPAFRFLEEDCHKKGIITKNCPKVNQDPIFSSVICSQTTNSRTIICTNQNFPILTYEMFSKINLLDYSWIHFEARNVEETVQMIERVKQYNSQHGNIIKTSLELEKPRKEDLMLTKNVDYIFFGKDYANFLGWHDLRSAILGLRNTIENKKSGLVCTWGSQGSAVLNSEDTYTWIEAHPPANIVDSLGAGDTFCASVIFALSRGENLVNSATFASKVTGHKLSFFGYDHVEKFQNQI